ncbi:MAG: hypothetical protein ACP5RI_01615 [Candidatus Micrarchaeia archaeon]
MKKGEKSKKDKISDVNNKNDKKDQNDIFLKNKPQVQLSPEDYKEISVPPVKIQNIVVSAELHAVIDLYTLSKHVKSVDYEPEQFPGAIFRIDDPKAVIILFKNGKMICTGASNEADVKRALDYAAKIISNYVLEVPKEEEKEEKKK